MSSERFEVFDISSDDESETDTVAASPSLQRLNGTPYPDQRSENQNRNYDDSTEVNVLQNQLERAVGHHLRFAIMVYTRLRALLNGYDETGKLVLTVKKVKK